MAVLPIASSIFVLCLYIFHALPTARSTLGFSAELIHRDSPESPLYDPSSTAFSRFHAAIHRSTGRANYFRNLTVSTDSNSLLFPTVENKLISSDLTNYRGQYLMTLGIGDAEDEVKGKRPHWTRVLLDTGEPLTWVLCKPCKNCYKHKDPIFNPEASSMYEKIRCRSNACTIHDGPCRSESELCRYNNTYMDGFSINGVLSNGTIFFDDSHGNNMVSVPGILFGCTHETVGRSSNKIGIGSIGLNGNSLSLTRQLNLAIGISSKFSYCLPKDNKKSSRIYFGSTAGAFGLRVMTTPLFVGSEFNHFYLHMENIIISVFGMNSLNLAMKQENNGRKQNGNIMIDSGSTLTYIAHGYMHHLLEKVKELIPNPQVKVPSKLANDIDLCFDWSEPMEDKLMPIFTFYFMGGVELEISQPFWLIGNNILCLAISSDRHTDGIAIFGSRSHTGYRTVYDLDVKKLTFVREDC